jgi:hypothetical protein
MRTSPTSRPFDRSVPHFRSSKAYSSPRLVQYTLRNRPTPSSCSNHEARADRNVARCAPRGSSASKSYELDFGDTRDGGTYRVERGSPGSLSDASTIAHSRLKGASSIRRNGSFYSQITSALIGVALAVGVITASWAAQRTVLKALPACPNAKDFTDWFEAADKGDASRAFDVIDGKGCLELNKGEVVEFERLLTHPFVVCVRPIWQSQCFWTSPFAISPQPRKR